MGEFVEFLVGPSGVRPAAWSWWVIRNESTLRIVEGAAGILKSEGSLRRDWRVRIYSADHRSGYAKERGLLEFQTIGDSLSTPDLFPDWNFGGWWHIGMKEWDPFVLSLAAAGSRPPEDRRAYWRGNHMGIPQRARYVELCASDPGRFAGGFMEWGAQGASKGFVPMEEQCRHAVLVDLTGLGYSGRLKMLGFTGRPLIVAHRRWWCWGDQVALSRGLHLTAREDLSDIADRYDEALGREGEARDLRDFCLSELTFEKACARAADLIRGEIRKRSILL